MRLDERPNGNRSLGLRDVRTTVWINNEGPFPCALNLTRDVEVVYGSAEVPDPNWTFIDGQGHLHAFDSVGVLPTAAEHSVPCDGACGDPGHTVIEYRCSICAEVVEPKRLTQEKTTSVPGPWTADLKVKIPKVELEIPGPGNRVSVWTAGKPVVFGTGWIMGYDWSSEGVSVEIQMDRVGSR